jgi:hypothetical protein
MTGRHDANTSFQHGFSGSSLPAVRKSVRQLGVRRIGSNQESGDLERRRGGGGELLSGREREIDGALP